MNANAQRRKNVHETRDLILTLASVSANVKLDVLEINSSTVRSASVSVKL